MQIREPLEFRDVPVVGMHFRDKEGVPASATVASITPPCPLELEPEPTNMYDPNALKVFFSSGDVRLHIGYIAAADAKFITPRLEEASGYDCIVENLESRRNNLHPICVINLYFDSDEAPADAVATQSAS